MGRMVTVEEWAEIHGKTPAAVRRTIRKGVWKKAQNVLVDGKLTWLLDEDWLWPKTITPAKQASLLCEIRKLMPPVVYATGGRRRGGLHGTLHRIHPHRRQCHRRRNE